MKWYPDPQHNRIIVNAADLPAAISSHSSCQKFSYGGEVLAALPLTEFSAQVYRMAGLDAPFPVRAFYHWPLIQGLYRPRLHQLETAEFFTKHGRCFCLNEIGTGKTYSALWAADYLMGRGKIRRVIVVSPLSTLDTVWFNSIYETFKRTAVVLHGTAEKRRRLFAKDFDFYIVNHDGLEILLDKQYDNKGRLTSASFPRDDIDLVICDELAVYRNYHTKKWALFDTMINRNYPNVMVWGMTGAPMPNAPTDAWAQVKLIQPDRVPRYFTKFRAMTMWQKTQFLWIPYDNAHEVVYSCMQPAIRFERDGTLDLPPVTYTDYHADLSAEQKHHLKRVINEFFTELASGATITPANEGVKVAKILQICGGVVYDDEGNAHVLDATPRLHALKETVESAKGKVIVFVPFRATLEHVATFLRKHGRKVAVVHGGVSKTERTDIFTRFQKAHDPDTLVADAGAMAHGLTLTEAATILWYGPEQSNETYEQANGRITREGQKQEATIGHIHSTETERRAFRRLKERGRMQGLLLDMVHDGTLSGMLK